jgi:DNA-binding HxlR family transcriptional regulator
VPPGVEYRLTAEGASQSAAVEPLQQWLTRNLPAPSSALSAP